MRPFIIFLLHFLLISSLFAENKPEEPIRYKWHQNYYGTLNGEKSLLFSREMRMSKLAFADIDYDGDQDIFLGQENGELAFFENQGSNQQPDYVLITQEYKAIFEHQRRGEKVKVWSKIDVGQRSAPSLVDIDDDGDLDLFIGSREGKIWFFKNYGNNLVPVFRLESSRYEGLRPGGNSTLMFADINLQRKKDLIVGTVDGKVFLYINRGTRKKADFQSSKPIQVVSFGLETHAVPALTDWDKDGDFDLVVGQKNGTLSLFLNKGDRFFPKWEFTEQHFQLIDIGGESAPYFVDMNGDNELDLVIGSANPTVFHYENKMSNKKRILWNRSTNLFKFHKLIVTGNRASMATGDLDGDGDLDMIVGEKAGNLNYYKNQSTTKTPNWVLQTEELIFMTGMEHSAPTLGDLDGDGDQDLLIGGKEGLIAFVENIGTKQTPKFTLRDKTYFQIDVGSNSVPRLHDIDRDGDLDLLIGNYAGRVVLFLNKGDKKKPVFALESTRFASVKEKRNSVPAFFDWKQTKQSDMVLGKENGDITLYLSPEGENDWKFPWKAKPEILAQFNIGNLSHPYFEDIDGDNQKDLLIGNLEGDFLLYMNRGIEEIKKEEPEAVDNSIDQKGGSLVVEDSEEPLNIGEGGEFTDQGGLGQDLLEDESANGEEDKLVRGDPKYVLQERPLIPADGNRWSTPTLGDLDQDGDPDLLVGSQNGQVFLYENHGSDIAWDFQLASSNYLKTGKLQHTAPLLVDLDLDGDLDILLGSNSGALHFFENQGSAEQPNYILDENLFKNFWLGANSRPAVSDLDDDGIPDLLVGNIWGKLVHIQNASNRFVIVRRDYQKMDVGINSSPALFDPDNSGIKKLIIGSDSGKIYFYKNEKDSLNGLWKKLPNYGGNLKFPRGSSPTIYDIDNDGDQDLISGSETGEVLLYRNDLFVPTSKSPKAESTIEEETEL